MDWESPPQQVALGHGATDAQKALYAQGLYTLLQYRVSAISPASTSGSAVALPSNWSRPVGPNQDQGATAWSFSATASVQALTGQATATPRRNDGHIIDQMLDLTANDCRNLAGDRAHVYTTRGPVSNGTGSRL